MLSLSILRYHEQLKGQIENYNRASSIFQSLRVEDGLLAEWVGEGDRCPGWLCPTSIFKYLTQLSAASDTEKPCPLALPLCLCTRFGPGLTSGSEKGEQLWCPLSVCSVPTAVTVPLGAAACTGELVVMEIFAHKLATLTTSHWAIHGISVFSAVSVAYWAACRLDSTVPRMRRGSERKCQLVFPSLSLLLLLQ